MDNAYNKEQVIRAKARKAEIRKMYTQLFKIHGRGTKSLMAKMLKLSRERVRQLLLD